jgi:hypothetical protein
MSSFALGFPGSYLHPIFNLTTNTVVIKDAEGGTNPLFALCRIVTAAPDPKGEPDPRTRDKSGTSNSVMMN